MKRNLICIAVTTFKDRGTIPLALESLAKTRYEPLKLYVIDYGSKKIVRLIETLQSRYHIDIDLIKVERDFGLSHRRNLCLKHCLDEKPEYIVLMDDDIVVKSDDWLTELVSLMENMPTSVVVLQSICNSFFGGKLYGNLTAYGFSKPPKGKDYWLALGGGAMFITKSSYITQLFKLGIKPFEEIFCIQSEDVDFAIKTIMLGYDVAVTGLVKVDHIGEQSGERGKQPPYRIYHMFKNRVLLALLNFRMRFLIRCLPYRILQDLIYVLRSCFRAPKTALLLIKAYTFVLRNLRSIMSARMDRISCYVEDAEDRIKKYILRLPMPLKLE